MKCYKLTDQNWKTRNNTKWGPNVTHVTHDNIDRKLCSSSWIHFYTDPVLAILMNPNHADFNNPVLWDAESTGEELHESLKSGAKGLTTIKIVETPEITIVQKVCFAILCSKHVYNNPLWIEWADKYLSGEDRTQKSAFDVAAFHAAAAVHADAVHAAAAAAAAVRAAVVYSDHASVHDYAAAVAAADAAAYASIHASVHASYVTIPFVQLAHQALTYK
jgi:hypothetical protein